MNETIFPMPLCKFSICRFTLYFREEYIPDHSDRYNKIFYKNMYIFKEYSILDKLNKNMEADLVLITLYDCLISFLKCSALFGKLLKFYRFMVLRYLFERFIFDCV